MTKRYPLNPAYKPAEAESAAPDGSVRRPDSRRAEAGSAAQGSSVRRQNSPLIGRGDANMMPQVEDLLALADTITSVRARRADIFPADLFAEPAWEMLLALYRADIAGHRMNVSNLVSASAGPPTTGIRWIARLEELGMVTRRRNPIDARVLFVELAPDTRQRVEDYLTETWVSLFAKA